MVVVLACGGAKVGFQAASKQQHKELPDDFMEKD